MEITSRFRFPDGQPHLSVRSGGGKVEELVARITSPDDLFDVLLAADALRRQGVDRVNLTIPYLMGARMDRPMPDDERGSHPFTLKAVADVIGLGDFDVVRVFDPHSEKALELLEGRCDGAAMAIVPWRQVVATLNLLGNPVVIIPDAGAKARTAEIFDKIPVGEGGYLSDREFVQVLKHRDSATGKLSGFGFEKEPGRKDLANRECLIVDDLCDGGGTFEGVAELLRGRGASKVHLYVSHGIFSKGFHLKGIDHIFTTDSYCDGLRSGIQHRPTETRVVPNHVTVFPWRV